MIPNAATVQVDTIHRVIAVRQGGDRMLISDQLSLEQAQALRDRLVSAGAFAQVLVESDEIRAGRSTDDGDALATISL